MSNWFRSVHRRTIQHLSKLKLILATIFLVTSAAYSQDVVIEDLSQEFRFTDILKAEITYELGPILSTIPEEGAVLGSLLMDIVPSPKEEFVSSNTPGVADLEGCGVDTCDPYVQTKKIVNVKPANHTDGISVYRLRVRARWQIVNAEGQPIYITFPLSTPPSVMTFAALHLRGDYNYDGLVNTADYTVWRDTLGSPNATADGDGSGIVDGGDYNLWKNRFGNSLDVSASVGAAIPESSILVLLISALLTSVSSFRRRRIA